MSLSGKLWQAAKDGVQSVVVDIVKSSDLLNWQDTGGRSVLYHALENGHQQLAIQLVNLGADLSQKDLTGWNIYHLISQNNLLTFLEFIQTKKKIKIEDLNAQTETGLTPLMLAVSDGYRELTQLLIGMGADQHLKDKDGQNALYKTIENDDLDCFKLLCKMDYRYQQQDNEGNIISDNILHLISKFGAVKLAKHLTKTCPYDNKLWHEKNAQGLTAVALANELKQFDVFLTFNSMLEDNVKSLQYTILYQNIDNSDFTQQGMTQMSGWYPLRTQLDIARKHKNFQDAVIKESALINSDVKAIAPMKGTISERERLSYR